MTKQEQRRLALGAVRSEARKHLNPTSLTAIEALAVLDDLGRSEPALIASQWYRDASDAQIKAFKKEWETWQRDSRMMSI